MAQAPLVATSVGDRTLPGFYFTAYGALGAFLPYFPPWLESHNFVGLRMSLIMALVPGLAAVVPPLVGRIADRRGARGNLLVVLSAVGAVSMLSLAAAETLGLASNFFYVLLAFLPFATCRPALIMMADRIALEGGGNYGHQRLWGSLGFLAIALTTGALASDEHTSRIPLFVGGLLALSVLVATRLPQSAKATKAAVSSKGAAQNPGPVLSSSSAGANKKRILVFLLVTGLFQIANISYQLCATLLFRDLGASGTQTGLLWGVGVVAEVVVMLVAGRFFVRRRPEALLVFAMLVAALRWAATAVLTSPDWAFVTQSLHGVTFGLALMCSLAYVKRIAPAEQLGRYQGWYMMAQSVGGVLGTFLWAPLYHSSGGQTVFGIAALLSLVSAGVTFGFLVEGRRSQSTPC